MNKYNRWIHEYKLKLHAKKNTYKQHLDTPPTALGTKLFVRWEGKLSFGGKEEKDHLAFYQFTNQKPASMMALKCIRAHGKVSLKH